MTEHHIKLEWQFRGYTQSGTFSLANPITIGRHSQSDIALNQPTVARQHGQIALNGDQVELSNLSTDKPIIVVEGYQTRTLDYGERMPLMAGSRFQIEAVVFSVLECNFTPAAVDGEEPKVQ